MKPNNSSALHHAWQVGFLRGREMELPSQKLKRLQELPLDSKILLSKELISEWYDAWGGDVWISFSGGKDSTVLVDIVRSIYPNIPAIFSNTGLEYPEILRFIKTKDNIRWVRPKKKFEDVIKRYGFPVITKKVSRQIHDIQNPTKNNSLSRRLYLTGIKGDGSISNSFKLPKKWFRLAFSDIRVSHKCCDILKKSPLNIVRGSFYVGNMATDSNGRRGIFIKNNGCGTFFKRGQSHPLFFWTEKDIWEYIRGFGIPYSKIYDMGERRTGCIFCMFGVHLEKNPNRFQRMKETHPRHYKYCINNLGIGKVLDFIGVEYN